MADSAVFDWTAEALERETSFDRLEARGTLRIALKAAGLEPRSVTRDQMSVVLREVLPQELASRGVPDEVALCTRMDSALASAGVDTDAPESPDAVFARLGG